MNERLQRAKDALAIADAANSKREAYVVAADAIVEEFESGTSYAEIARALGRDRSYVQRLVAWRSRTETNGVDLPFAEPQGAVGDRHARTALADPARRRRVLDEMPPETRAEVARDALEDEETRRGLVQRSPETVRSIEQAAREEHPANRRSPVHVPEPETSFYEEMAPAWVRLRDAATAFRAAWEANVEEASPEDRERVGDDLAGLVAELSSLTTNWDEVPR